MPDPTAGATGRSTLPLFEDAPYRYSGVVYGVLMNDPASLAALGDAASQAPYKAPPRAPVLYIKPRNTLAASGASVCVPEAAGAFEIGASLGLVIGRTACRVSESNALAHLAGFVTVADLSVPHSSFYRPSYRFKARDGSCLIGPRMVPCDQIADPDALAIEVNVAGELVQRASTAGMQRSVARLLADVSEFMTLNPGDILLLGIPHGAPHARAGQSFAIEIAGLGRLEGTLTAEEEIAA